MKTTQLNQKGDIYDREWLSPYYSGYYKRTHVYICLELSGGTAFREFTVDGMSGLKFCGRESTGHFVITHVQ